MTSEHTVQTTTAPHVSAPSPAPTTDSSKGKELNNIMLILAMLEKGTMDSNGKSEKYYNRQREDGAWMDSLMKLVSEGVDNGNPLTPYKNAEKLIDNYMQEHKGTHFDANQILSLSSLKNMNASMKADDTKIGQLVKSIQDEQNDIKGDKSDISKEKDALYAAIAAAALDFGLSAAAVAACEVALHVTEGKLAKHEKELGADNEALGAKQIEEGGLFSQGVYAQKDRGQRLKSTGDYMVSKEQSENQQIMSFAASFFVPMQA